ncbi:MAG: TlpA disulfide reductase family protein [Bryobacteraceae bacterium]
MKTLAAFLLLAAPLAWGQDKLVPVDEAGFRKLIASQKGKIVLADFWATWCVPCRKEMPELVALQAKLKARGVELITISADEPEQEKGALQFLKQHRVQGTVYVKRPKDDDAFINAIDPKWSGALPALFVFDRAGKKVKAFIGETPIGQLEAALAKIP